MRSRESLFLPGTAIIAHLKSEKQVGRHDLFTSSGLVHSIKEFIYFSKLFAKSI